MAKHICVVLLVLLIIAAVPSFGQLREHPDISLKDLRGLRVVVNYEGPVEEAYGLTKAKLQEAAELRIKANDVTILSAEEWSRAPGRPYLNFTIVGTQVGSDETPTFFYSFATDFIQEVSLSRMPSFKTEAATWNQDYSLVVSKDDLREVTLKISDVANDFAQSVREANK